MLQYITKTLCFMPDSQQGGELDGICITSYTSIKSLNADSPGMSWSFTVFRVRVLDGFKPWV